MHAQSRAKRAQFRAPGGLVFGRSDGETSPAPPALLIPGGWRIEGLPGTVREAGPSAERRLLEFFTAEISNPNTRLAYSTAAAPGGEAFNSGISVNENQRTNLGAFNFGGTPSSIQARIFDRFGTLVQAIRFEMSPYSWS